MIRIAIVVVGACLVAGAPRDAAIKKELENFQGTWQLVAAETDGKKAPEERVQKIKVVIKGAKHSVYFGDDAVVKEIPFSIDPTKSPKTVDDHLPDGKEIHGIYELDGVTLKSCVAPVGKDRPKEFSAAAGTGNTLRLFKKVK